MRFLVCGLCAVIVTACAAGTTDANAPPPPPGQPGGPDASGTPDAPQAGPPVTDVQSFCAARAAAECSDAVVSQCGVKDKASCITAGTAACIAAVPQGTTFQPGKAQPCLAAVTAAYSTGQITADAEAAINQACGPAVFSGPGAARAPCTGPYDCSSAQGLTCVVPFPPPTDGTGKCLAPNDVAPGASCSGEADVCAAGYYCEPKAQQCVAASLLGQPCAPGYQPCAPGLTCPGGIFGSVCGAGGADGAPCTAATDCGSSLCDKPANQAAGNCASVVVLSSLDSMCTPFN
jgi:hypothetical protein